MSHKFPEAEARKLLSSFNFEPIGEYPAMVVRWGYLRFANSVGEPSA